MRNAKFVWGDGSGIPNQKKPIPEQRGSALFFLRGILPSLSVCAGGQGHGARARGREDAGEGQELPKKLAEGKGPTDHGCMAAWVDGWTGHDLSRADVM